MTEKMIAASVGCGVVHVVDDDEPVRQAIELLLLSAGFRVQTYASGLAFLDVLPSLDSDSIGCVLTDIRMPGLDGIALLLHLRNIGFMRPVIVMTALGDIETAVRVMKGGAADFIEKPFDDDAFLDIIRSALFDGQANHAGALTKDIGQLPHRWSDAIRRMAMLSQRQREVLALLTAGKPNKLVAYDLGISQRTVEMHRARMMNRLGVKSLAEAVRIAIRLETTGNDLPSPVVTGAHDQ